MFERLSDATRAVVSDAEKHARRLGHRWLGCEHLLLAAAGAAEPAGDALRRLGITPTAVEAALRAILEQTADRFDREALAAIGIDLDTVRQRAEATFGSGALSRPARRHRGARRMRSCRQPAGDVLPFSPRAKSCLQRAVEAARTEGSGTVDVVQLVCAMTEMDEGMAPRVFTAIGVRPEQVRNELGCYSQGGYHQAG